MTANGRANIFMQQKMYILHITRTTMDPNSRSTTLREFPETPFFGPCDLKFDR